MYRLSSGLVALICLLLCTFSLPAQNDPQLQLRGDIETYILNFRFEQARARIPSLLPKAYGAYYELSIDVYQYLATQEDQYFQHLVQNWSRYVDLVDKLPDSHPDKELLLAEMYCKRAAVEFLEKNYFSALNYARNGRNHALKQQKRFPQHSPVFKVLGVFNAVFGAVPSRYLWLTDILGYEGDTEQGLAQLRRSAASDGPLSLESVLFASYIEKIMRNDATAGLKRLQEARQQRAPSLVLDYFCALAYLQNKQTDPALELLQKRVKQQNPQQFPLAYLDYQLGKAYYYKGAYTSCYSYLQNFLSHYKGNLFRTDARFKLGLAYTLTDNYSQGRTWFDSIVAQHNSGFDQDEYAAHLARKFSIHAPGQAVQALFQARHFYDGGYYEQAEKILGSWEQKISQLDVEERTELYYRMGRLRHSQGQSGQASTYYRYCLAEKPQEQSWLQAYAYYYLGEIALAEGQNQMARQQYEKALTFDDYWYQSGLENRCKARLSELKRKESSP